MWRSCYTVAYGVTSGPVELSSTVAEGTRIRFQVQQPLGILHVVLLVQDRAPMWQYSKHHRCISSQSFTDVYFQCLFHTPSCFLNAVDRPALLHSPHEVDTLVVDQEEGLYANHPSSTTAPMELLLNQKENLYINHHIRPRPYSGFRSKDFLFHVSPSNCNYPSTSTLAAY